MIDIKVNSVWIGRNTLAEIEVTDVKDDEIHYRLRAEKDTGRDIILSRGTFLEVFTPRDGASS